MKSSVHRQNDQADEGAALIITLMVLAVVAALSATVAAVTINNLGSSVKAQQAGSALNAADAGVAQAITHLRDDGFGSLNKCSTDTDGTAAACTDDPWGNKDKQVEVDIPGIAGQVYTVWIQPIEKFPAKDPGVYRIHSTGKANGAASREVYVDIQTSKEKIPFGIVANQISGNGNFSATNESFFSTGCVFKRSQIVMTGIDAAYKTPAGVHSSQIITDDSGNGPCTDKSAIHKGNTFCPLVAKSNPPVPAYPGDQDVLGGRLDDTPCDARQQGYKDYYGQLDYDGVNGWEVDGSYVKDQAALERLYNFTQPPLSALELESLRSVAMSQGNFHTSAGGWNPPTQRQAVMYFDLTDKNDNEVNLSPLTDVNRLPGLPATADGCRDRSLTIVIEDGNARLNAGTNLVASVFLTSINPKGGEFVAVGGSKVIGTIYADKLTVGGGSNFSMDECFMSHLGKGMQKLTQVSYVEQDR